MIKKAQTSRNEILAVATEHFALRGYHGASVREITEQADVNLAAVNYHFRNKESLYREVLSSGLNLINQTRTKKLERAIELAGDAPVPLAMIMEIFVEPLFELCAGPTQPNHFLARLIGRSATEPHPFIQEFLRTNQHGFITRFAQAIRRHVPTMKASEFMWRLSFVVGSLYHALATLHCMRELTQGLCPNNDVKQTTTHFVQFAVNTIQAAVKSPDQTTL